MRNGKLSYLCWWKHPMPVMLKAPQAQSCTGSNLKSQLPRERPPHHVISARQSVSACLLWFVAWCEVDHEGAEQRTSYFLCNEVVLLRNLAAVAVTLTINPLLTNISCNVSSEDVIIQSLNYWIIKRNSTLLYSVSHMMAVTFECSLRW